MIDLKKWLEVNNFKIVAQKIGDKNVAGFVVSHKLTANFPQNLHILIRQFLVRLLEVIDY